jgi:hypothetical protein
MKFTILAGLLGLLTFGVLVLCRPAESGPASFAKTRREGVSSEPSADPIVARWQTDRPGNIVEVRRVAGGLRGELVASSSPKVPVGTVILRELEEHGEGYQGQIYSPKHDRTVKASFAVEGTG